MAKITHYDQGDVWTPQSTFTVAGTPTDVTNITVKTKNPAGTIVTLGPVAGSTGGSGIVRVSAGIYKTDIALDSQGYWFVRFEGTGTAAATEDSQAIVDPTEFYETPNARNLVSLAETKDWLQVQNIDTVNDLELERVITDVSDRMHHEAGREFKAYTAGSAARLFDVGLMGKREPWYVDGVWMGDLNPATRTSHIGDLSAAPTLVRILDRDWTTVLETVSAANYAALPLVRAPWEPIRELCFQDTVTSLSPGMRVEVTGTWGFPAVPGNVRQAVLDSVASIMDRDVEHYATDLAPASAGGSQNVIILGQGSSRLLSLPPAAIAVAWSYRDNWLG